MGGERADLVAELGSMSAPDPETARLLGMIVALAGELQVLKAQVERLSRALQAQGALAPEALEAAGGSDAFRAWLAQEENAFARHLFAPYLKNDVSLNVTHWMREE